MKTTMLGFLAETAIHCGSGRSAGLIDLPIAREAATDYPFIPGSGLKGAMRDRVKMLECGDVEHLFGKPDCAGQLLISDARLLLLPVRSLSGAYRWLTSPQLLERYARDLARCGLTPTDLSVPEVPAGQKIDKLYLEEREFTVAHEVASNIIDAIKPLIRNEQTRARLDRQLVILSDDDFTWFCRYALAIQARNVLDDGTKQSKNLWFEERLPTDSVLYALVTARDSTSQEVLTKLFPESDAYLQVGGNETVGQGWVAVSVRGDS